MEKIRFITDSASDMNNSREDVTILPLHIRFGEEEYADGVTISHKEFYEKLIECDTLPTTSLVSPAVFEEAYEKAVSAGETVIVVTISSQEDGNGGAVGLEQLVQAPARVPGSLPRIMKAKSSS